LADAERAIAWANNSEYGLALSVWTMAMSKSMEVAAALRYGSTWIDTHLSFWAAGAARRYQAVGLW
jgi:acyl-CoA reductase-like NAD-dependent aldehyde dehydrogenase